MFMKQIIHRKKDVIAIVRYLLQNYDSKFRFIIEPKLCVGYAENGFGKYGPSPIWVMRVKFSDGSEINGRYTESFGKLGFSKTYGEFADIFSRGYYMPLQKGNEMILKDEHRRWVFGIDAEGAFVRTDFRHFASTKKQALRWFQQVYPDFEPRSVELKLMETGRPVWVIAATNRKWICQPTKVYLMDPIGFICCHYALDLSAEPFDKGKEYFLFDSHRHWIGCARHIMGVKWEKGKGLVPMTLSQMTQPLPELGADRFDSNSLAFRCIMD